MERERFNLPPFGSKPTSSADGRSKTAGYHKNKTQLKIKWNSTTETKRKGQKGQTHQIVDASINTREPGGTSVTILILQQNLILERAHFDAIFPAGLVVTPVDGRVEQSNHKLGFGTLKGYKQTKKPLKLIEATNKIGKQNKNLKINIQFAWKRFFYLWKTADSIGSTRHMMCSNVCALLCQKWTVWFDSKCHCKWSSFRKQKEKNNYLREKLFWNKISETSFISSELGGGGKITFKSLNGLECLNCSWNWISFEQNNKIKI